MDKLAVKKIGKKIKKTPLHLPSLANDYTSKNRSRRSIVPQLTSSPLPKIRPTALAQINRPHDVPAMVQPTHNLARPPMMGHAAESPVSASLLSSSGDSGPSARFSGGGGGGILPTPVSVCIHSPQSSFGDSGPNRNQMKPSHDYQQRFYGSSASILRSPRFDGPGILPTPPGVQYPSPLQPTSFTSSSIAQGGILGPGKFPRPPYASTGLVFPPSPFGENTNN